jgi:MoxR-like ATPase
VLRTTSGQSGDQLPLADVKPRLNERIVLGLQQIAARQKVDQKVIDYAVRIVRATRDWPGLAVGSGSRGAMRIGTRRARRRAHGRT